jgi:hypothetical protein
MLTKIAHLERLGGFRLRVRFSDGSEGVHDFSSMVNEPGPCSSRCRTKLFCSRLSRIQGADLAERFRHRS